MVTMVGLEKKFETLLEDLIELDYDAVEAYEAAAERLEKPEYKNAMLGFLADHRRHVEELSALARSMNIEPPDGPDVKAFLTKGKVVIADLMGDKAILVAMKTNEEDTNTAYERAFNHEDLPPQARDVIERGLADERRHRQWIVDTLMKMKAAA